VEDQGIDPNMRDSDGATAVHFAASRGHIDTLTYLLEHGAFLTFDKYGKSPLNDAAENEQVEVSGCHGIMNESFNLPPNCLISNV